MDLFSVLALSFLVRFWHEGDVGEVLRCQSRWMARQHVPRLPRNLIRQSSGEDANKLPNCPIVMHGGQMSECDCPIARLHLLGSQMNQLPNCDERGPDAQLLDVIVQLPNCDSAVRHCVADERETGVECERTCPRLLGNLRVRRALSSFGC